MACPRLTAQVDQRVVLLEGSLGITPWSFGGDTARAGTPFDVVSSRRARVLQDLIRFHGIDVIQSHGWRADRLVATVNRNLEIPWFIDLRCEKPGFRADTDCDPDFERLIAPILSSAQGVFYSDPEDLSIFARLSLDDPTCAMQVFDSVQALASNCRPDRLPDIDQDDFRVLLACTNRSRYDADEHNLVAAVQHLNALNAGERGHRRIRLIVPRSLYGRRQPYRSFVADCAMAVREVDAQVHEIAIHCDAGLIMGASPSRDATACLIECLASGLPVVGDARAVPPEMLRFEDFTAGISVASDASGELSINRLLGVLREYLRNAEHHARDQRGAHLVYDQRFHLDMMADRFLSAYRLVVGQPERFTSHQAQLRIA
jgi:hypothetical protein